MLIAAVVVAGALLNVLLDIPPGNCTMGIQAAAALRVLDRARTRHARVRRWTNCTGSGCPRFHRPVDHASGTDT